VIVLEKSNRVGGQIWVGAGSPLRKNWGRIGEFYSRQARKLDVRLGIEADADKVMSLNPDVVVIATGSTPVRFSIPGALTVHEVVAGKANHAKRVVVLDREGFNRAMVAADYLSAWGIEVDFVTPLNRVGRDVESMMLDELIHRFKERGMRFHPGEDVVRASGKHEIVLKNMASGQERTLSGIDALVATVGSTPVSALADTLRMRISEMHVIGDALAPRTVEDATYEGASLGRTL